MIGEYIRGWRTEHQMSAAEFARQVELDGTTILAIEKGRILRPAPATLQRMAAVMKLPIEELTGQLPPPGARRRASGERGSGGPGSEFGARLEQLRAARALSREELAHAAGLSVAGIWKLETGRVLRPAPDTLQKLAEALKITPEELRGPEPDRPAQRAAPLTLERGAELLQEFGRLDPEAQALVFALVRLLPQAWTHGRPASPMTIDEAGQLLGLLGRLDPAAQRFVGQLVPLLAEHPIGEFPPAK